MRALFVVAILGLFSTAAVANIDVVDQRYIDQLSKGGLTSIKQAAQSIYNTGEMDTEVLDVAAEVLLSRYPTAARNEIDTLAWVCRAIGNSRNSRYSATLREVSEGSADRKLRKYASQALSQVGDGGTQYRKGSVNLAALRSGSSSASSSSAAAAPAAAPASTGRGAGLESIKVGMSMQEVYGLVGQPTATTTHQTGKAWIPFNYGGKDLARTHLLYKGKGRVICSHDAYSSVSRVQEVVIDPEETGYP
ncbi:MAG: hypothetical protein HKN19_12980 [Halioglobus sp.]|nr:hypothetical protein [Halioglobus sp.]